MILRIQDASQTLKKTFLVKPCIYFLKVFGIEIQNEDTSAEVTGDTFTGWCKHEVEDEV